MERLLTCVCPPGRFGTTLGVVRIFVWYILGIYGYILGGFLVHFWGFMVQ